MDISPPVRTSPEFRAVKLLAGAYLAVSLVTLAAIIALRNHSHLVNSAVWVRGTIVAASAVLTFLFAVRAARGSRPAYRRLRILSAVMVVAIVVIIALPGTFPVWLKVEQGACGVLLLGVVAIVNRGRVRVLFA
jgi:hypothetical protein